MAPRLRKAVIPAAGLGTRFLPATKAQPKEMLPLLDKPAIQYVVEEAVRAGLKDVLIVTGRGKRALEDHFDRSYELEAHLEQAGRFGEASRLRAIAEMARFHYVRQPVPTGLGAALACAADHVGEEPFGVLLADDVLDPESNVMSQLIQVFEETGGFVLALKEVPSEEISRYGVARVEEGPSGHLRVVELVEKPTPSSAPSRLAVVGRYVFEASIFDYLSKTRPGKGGEIQLTDAIATAIGNVPVHAVVTTAERFDVGNKEDFVRANLILALRDPVLSPGIKAFLKELRL
jgi:UTP--glucose-1-phosphate uridylyltransferase